jgi:hypothetical protein
MAGIRRLLEWYLGLPVASAGQRTDWRIEFHWASFPGGTSAYAVLVGALLAAFVMTVYWQDGSRVSRRMRILLASLRVGLLGLAFLFLLQLTVSVGRIGLPVIVLLVDDSASMGLEDRYPDGEENALADALCREAKISPKSRLGLAQALLTRNDSQFVRRLMNNHVLRLYHFSDSAVPVHGTGFSKPADVPELTRQILALKAQGKSTRPGPALRKVLEDFRGTPPAAIVLFSDGISSTGDADRLTSAAEAATGNFTPVYAVALGSQQPARDIQLYDVSAEELAFVGDPLTVSGKIKREGFERQPIAVRLLDRETGRVLAETAVPAAKEAEAASFSLSYVPSAPGERDLVIEAPPQPEESNRDNNSERRHVSIRQEKIRVLLADLAPRWEFRYLKTLLERDPTVSLKTVLQEAEIEYASEDQTALPHFPFNKEELSRFDVLILGDLNPALIGPPTLELIRDFVRDSGGGVLMIAGPSFNPLGYRGTPLEDLVPLDLAEAQSSGEGLQSSLAIHPALTIDGLRGTSIFRFAGTEEATLEVWKKFPELHWTFGMAPIKPPARVFVAWRNGNGPGEIPLVAMQPVGAGKVLFHATDEFWRWRFRAGDLYYGPYWTRAVRYLSRSRLLGRDRGAELTSDRLVYSQGESPSLRVRFFDERFAPAANHSVVVTIERRNGERRTIALARGAGQSTVFEGHADALPVGTYHAWVTSPSFREAPPSSDFRVETASDELIKRNLDRRELEQTARMTRGAYVGLADASDLPYQIAPGHPVPLTSRERIPLWNRWEGLVLFAGLLVAEWILRRRARLL